ncbi:WD repeat protein [Grosmannia clavigera kw1407]|uniref:WD repeat protein n=1 Tax=Grosmannia clavigera (strain kw1407 / UAMH 11150) TaxID=655863 RepID=F0XTR7_GROCL|nr:WD repeat protein [Grosmannia clavigera kw1407]EFW98813.1 WD repeat protein [Grosmannia clavigera kw1407]
MENSIGQMAGVLTTASANTNTNGSSSGRVLPSLKPESLSAARRAVVASTTESLETAVKTFSATAVSPVLLPAKRPKPDRTDRIDQQDSNGHQHKKRWRPHKPKRLSRLSRLSWTFEQGRQVFLLSDSDEDEDIVLGGTAEMQQVEVEEVQADDVEGVKVQDATRDGAIKQDIHGHDTKLQTGPAVSVLEAQDKIPSPSKTQAVSRIPSGVTSLSGPCHTVHLLTGQQTQAAVIPSQPVEPSRDSLPSPPTPPRPPPPVVSSLHRSATPTPAPLTKLLASSPMTPQTARRPVRTGSQAGHSRTISTDPRLVFDRLPELDTRPYLSYASRSCLSSLMTASTPTILGADVPISRPAVVHVDFQPDEVLQVLQAASAYHRRLPSSKGSSSTSSVLRRLKRLVREHPDSIASIAQAAAPQTHLGHSSRSAIPDITTQRTTADVRAFLADLLLTHRIPSAAAVASATSPASAVAITLERQHHRSQTAARQSAQRSTLMFARAVAGQHGGFGYCGRLLAPVSFVHAIRRLREDRLRLRGEWTSCAGDIATVSWTSPDAFLCGTVTHMDQYNRQGNLVLASVTAGSLRAYAEHRVLRASSTPSATPSSSSPWLYTSVVSSDCARAHGLAFSAGFDRAVRVWRVQPDGSAMTALAEWPHAGNVNFVVASTDPAGLVATAADVAAAAVRVYRLGPGMAAAQHDTPPPYRSFSCSRIVDGLEDRGPGPEATSLTHTPSTYPHANTHTHTTTTPRRWAYLPAAVRWGLAPAVCHLLLVGYSPRGLSVSAEDDDIPEDRRNSGELCLWDAHAGDRWRITGAGTSQNVFEVAWHPSQPCFAAATAPAGNAVESNVRTQIRIYWVVTGAAGSGPAPAPGSGSGSGSASPPDVHTAHELHVLDCCADDINELALLPNSTAHLYVAAGCTNGHTYVWDTARGGLPVQDLAHGRFLEEQAGDKISVEDTGVKFVAWGATPDRLYTGSSDGVVKVWNVRCDPTGQKPLVRDLLECKASVSFGAFSPDKSRLVIGDASGRVFLLTVDGGGGFDDSDEEGFISEEEAASVAPAAPSPTRGRQPRHAALAFRRQPPGILRHPSPPPPRSEDTETDAETDADRTDPHSGCARARTLVRTGCLVVVPDRTVGAVQGPRYADTGLFCRPCHLDGDPAKPLLAACERDQQQNRPRACDAPLAARLLLPIRGVDKDVAAAHRRNTALDLRLSSLAPGTCVELYQADRGTLQSIAEAANAVVDYGFVYEETPDFGDEEEPAD